MQQLTLTLTIDIDGRNAGDLVDDLAIDLAQPGLIWCKTCEGVLPAPTALQQAASEQRELQSWKSS